MIRSRYPFVSLLALLTVTSAAIAADKKQQLTPPPPALPGSWQNLPAEWEKKEKLRRAISLPRISITIGYKVNRRGIFDNMGAVAAVEVTSQITQIEKELKGDATDAVRYSRLSDLYSRAQRSDKSKETGLKAAALFRKQLEQHPDDVDIQLRLSDVLGKPEEAEALVRRVVKDRPNEWRLAFAG